jgi:hypothetical protein
MVWMSVVLPAERSFRDAAGSRIGWRVGMRGANSNEPHGRIRCHAETEWRFPMALSAFRVLNGLTHPPALFDRNTQ